VLCTEKDHKSENRHRLFYTDWTLSFRVLFCFVRFINVFSAVQLCVYKLFSYMALCSIGKHYHWQLKTSHHRVRHWHVENALIFPNHAGFLF